MIIIDGTEERRLKLIYEILYKKHIYISYEKRIDSIIDKFSHLNLIKSGDISYTILYAFVIRKHLNKTLLNKLEKV